MKRPILVAAGTPQEYRCFCRERGLTYRDAAFITRHEMLLGMKDADVYFVGSFHHRHDAHEIVEEVKIRQYSNGFMVRSLEKL